MVTIPRRILAFALLLAVASLWLRAAFPVTAIGSAGLDDLLFVRTARFLGAGQWLGPYGPTTLAKGMFYPLFVLVCFLLHIPVLIGEHITYLAVSAVVAAVVGRSSRIRVGLVLFALLAFNPVLWNEALQRVVREGLYISLSLGCVTLMVICVFATARRLRWRLVSAGTLGLALGAFWLTREEGPWLLPALASVPVVALLPRGLHGMGRRRRALRIGTSLCGAGLVAAAMVLSVAAMNWRTYGVFLTTEFQGGAFPRAYGALARISSDAWQPYVVLPSDAAARAFSASAAAQELSPYLTGPGAAAYATIGCTQMDVHPCPGILSAWFMWAMRDAARETGHTGTAPEAQAYYTRIASEVNGACDAGRIACGPRLTGFLPPFRASYVAPTVRAAAALAWMLVHVDPEQIGSRPSYGATYEQAVIGDMAGPLQHGFAARMVIKGWVAGSKGIPSLAILGPVPSQTRLLLSESTPGAPIPGSAATFELQTDCQGDCTLRVLSQDGTAMSFPVQQLAQLPEQSQSGLTLHVEHAAVHDPYVSQAELQRVQVRIATVVARLYGVAMPVGFVLATLGVLLAVARRRVTVPLLALSVACLIAVGCRVALLAVLDATAIPAVNVLYTSPASPLVIVFVVTGCWFGWSARRRRAQ